MTNIFPKNPKFRELRGCCFLHPSRIPQDYPELTSKYYLKEHSYHVLDIYDSDWNHQNLKDDPNRYPRKSSTTHTPKKIVEVPACPKAEERTSASSGMAGYLTLPLLQIGEKIKDNKKKHVM